MSLMSSSLYSQSTVDVVSIFKMQLFLDRDDFAVKEYKEGRLVRRGYIRNDSLYYVFSDFANRDFKYLDTLNIYNEYDRGYSMYKSKLAFYSLRDKYNPEDYVLYDTTKISRNDFYIFETWVSETVPYILAIDHASGRSYRISGFNGNDFLDFLSDFKEFYKSYNKINLSDKKILKNFNVEGIDLKCIYKGLRDKKWIREERTEHWPVTMKKYPCLQRVYHSNIVVMH